MIPGRRVSAPEGRTDGRLFLPGRTAQSHRQIQDFLIEGHFLVQRLTFHLHFRLANGFD